MLEALSVGEDGWTLHEALGGSAAPTAALFTTSNGYVGVRAGAVAPHASELVLVAGCYEARPYATPERSYGNAERAQTLIPVTDPFHLTVTVDGEALATDLATPSDGRRVLDLRTGDVTTTTHRRTRRGDVLTITSRRAASLTDAELIWSDVELTVRDAPTELEVTVGMQAPTGNRTAPAEPAAVGRAWGRYLRPRSHCATDEVLGLLHTTEHSGRALACALATDALLDSRPLRPIDVAATGDAAHHRFSCTLTPGATLVLRRRAALCDGAAAAADDILERATAIAGRARSVPHDELLASQRRALDEYWRVAAVDLDGAPDIQFAVRFGAFQLFQAAARRGDRAAPVKALTGQGYEGHQLWEQEIYVGHVLDLLMPSLSRCALEFRLRTLPQARARARELRLGGAQYPWRTIDGNEASAFFPAGAAQHHVNAAIAWAIDHHIAATGDAGLLAAGGLDVLVETARAWLTIGWHDERGRFRIDGVTGPDEYTALIDNNTYTNLMVARHLRSAAQRATAVLDADGPDARSCVERLRLTADEVARWLATADDVVVPYDPGLGVHGQDDRFLDRPRWDLTATPADHFPLQEHYPLMTLYRHQVLKQADVLLAALLLPERFDRAQRRRDYLYYEPLTTHDSSLSASIHACIAADIGLLDDAWRCTRETATVDLDDTRDELGDGIHLAAAAGAWMAVACGFGGLRLVGGRPVFRPQLPPGVTGMRFSVRYCDRTIDVDVTAATTTYRIDDGAPLAVVHDELELTLEPAGPAVAATITLP